MDITTGMSAFQTFYLYFKEKVTGWNICLLISKLGYGVYSSCATDEKFPFIFRIEIQQDITVHETFFQGKCTGQPRLFVYCEQAFQRTVLDGIICQNSEFCGYSDSVIGSECRAFGFHPFTINFCFDRIDKKIVFHVIILFADHIHV